MRARAGVAGARRPLGGMVPHPAHHCHHHGHALEDQGSDLPQRLRRQPLESRWVGRPLGAATSSSPPARAGTRAARSCRRRRKEAWAGLLTSSPTTVRPTPALQKRPPTPENDEKGPGRGVLDSESGSSAAEESSSAIGESSSIAEEHASITEGSGSVAEEVVPASAGAPQSLRNLPGERGTLLSR